MENRVRSLVVEESGTVARGVTTPSRRPHLGFMGHGAFWADLWLHDCTRLLERSVAGETHHTIEREQNEREHSGRVARQGDQKPGPKQGGFDMTSKPCRVGLVGVVALGLALLPAHLASQGNGLVTDPSLLPYHGFLVTGYGSTGYTATLLDGATPNSFTASLSPVFLFQIRDRFLFESELEFEFEDGGTAVGLEYAQIGYSLTNNITVGAGKFLLPFNVFSERLHPTWINKLASPPALYGHHGGPGPTDAMLPVLSDIGAQLRSSFNLSGFWYLTATGYVTQGPQLEEAHEELPAEPGHAVPEIAFGNSVEDNNENKLLGGRIGIGVSPYFEVNVSGMTGAYDPSGSLDFDAVGVHVEGRRRGLEVHGELIRTTMALPPETVGGEIETLVRDGYTAQLGYRVGSFEPVVRWSRLFPGETEHEELVGPGRQLGVGLAYWMTPSLVAKAELLVNRGDNEKERLAIQWAFGF